MKIQLVAMMALLALVQSCSSSSSSSQTGNTGVNANESTGGELNGPITNDGANPDTNPGVAPGTGPDSAPELGAEEDKEPQAVQLPAPVVIELNDIEKAILNVRTTDSRFPPSIDRLNFKDPSPGMSVPDVDKPTSNSPFNNTIRRVSSADKFSVGDTSPTHQYSKRQAWNSNETLISVGDKILRTSDYKILLEHVPISSARNWSNVQPNTMFGLRFNDGRLNDFGKYNVAKDQFTLIKRFDRFTRCTIGNGEGSISNNDQFVVLSCIEDAGNTKLISFDITNATILGEISAKPDMNWASFSQSGRFIVVGNSGSSDDTQNIVKYQPNFSEPDKLSKRSHHGDLGIDRYGDDVIVMIAANRLSYIRLKDKLKVTYPVTDSSNPTGFGHVSCRNIKRPGWCYVSTYNQFRLAAIRLDYNGSSTLTADEDGEYSFEGVAVIEPWGVHRSTSGNYERQPRASASPSGHSIVYSSDWYGATGANAYVISAE